MLSCAELMTSSKPRQFLRSGARGSHEKMIRYICVFRERFGVESICRGLGVTVRGFITPREYRAANASTASDRVRRDAALIPVVKELHRVNYGVYGVHNMWHAMRLSGWVVSQDQVARLMRLAGSRGRGARWQTPRHRCSTCAGSPSGPGQPKLCSRFSQPVVGC